MAAISKVYVTLTQYYILGVYLHVSARHEVSMIKAVTGTAVHRHQHQWWQQWRWCQWQHQRRWQWHTTDKSWLHRLIGMYAKWAKKEKPMGKSRIPPWQCWYLHGVVGVHVERQVGAITVRAGTGESGRGGRVHHRLCHAVSVVPSKHIVHLTIGCCTPSPALILYITIHSYTIQLYTSYCGPQ